MPRSSVLYLTFVHVVVDVLAIVAAIWLAYYLRFGSGIIPYQEFHPFHNYGTYLAFLCLATPIVFASNGLYRPRRSISWLDHSYAIFSSASVATAIGMVSTAVIWRDVDSSRLMVALAWVFMVVALVLGRLIVHLVQTDLRRRGIGAERLLIVGTGEPAHLVLDRVRHAPHMGYRPVGFVGDSHDSSVINGLPVLGTLDNVAQIVHAHQIHDVVVAMPTLSQQRLLELVTQCTDEKVNIKVFPDLFQFMTSGVNTGDLDGLPLISVKDVALRGWNLALKRAMDVIVSATVLVIFSPFMLLIAVLIKLTSPEGPVFFIQDRVGLDGRPFPVIKFRTMRPDAEKETGAVWATKGDPRRTPVGALLRRFSLDELPQLINVLVGDMSLVGPRPERPVFVEKFRQTIPRYFDRHREKAGLTGWAQVNGLRGNTSIEERTAYDIWYVENWTFWLDLKILLKTLFVVLFDRNAY
ncbi:MAG TPA: undecaprenyl-phosphate glucose phosphotransferase [Chloroflexota bacterium]|nr:undecaprenyl-phosphate glucose phosphotransferase [Chloroflexota bacterium]